MCVCVCVCVGGGGIIIRNKCCVLTILFSQFTMTPFTDIKPNLSKPFHKQGGINPLYALVDVFTPISNNQNYK